jgi:ribokinase
MNIVVVGYASLDYAVRLDRPPRADTTTTVISRAAEWPRLGGSPAYVAAALAKAGIRDAVPISWVGEDADGARYREGLARLGPRTDGVATRPGRTPVCILAYQPGGACYCLYDPGLAEPLDLDARQLSLVAAADWVCLTVGPKQATRTALAAARPDARVVWAVKADARAVPADLAAAIAARADIVAFSRGEAKFVARARAAAEAEKRSQILIETHGREGVAVSQGGPEDVFPVDPVEADDTTGAGDTFLGGFLAASILTGATQSNAVKAGINAARVLLAARAARAGEN